MSSSSFSSFKRSKGFVVAYTVVVVVVVVRVWCVLCPSPPPFSRTMCAHCCVCTGFAPPREGGGVSASVNQHHGIRMGWAGVVWWLVEVLYFVLLVGACLFCACLLAKKVKTAAPSTDKCWRGYIPRAPGCSKEEEREESFGHIIRGRRRSHAERQRQTSRRYVSDERMERRREEEAKRQK